MSLLVDFAGIDPSAVADVGGKAVNLGVMSAAGLPVPEGFCITTPAYRAVVGHALDDLLGRLAAAEEAGELAALAAQARERLLALEPPAALRDAIVQHYEALGASAPVAVRSSATAEDLAYASFAGQQDTFLNVVGGDAVIAAVRRCWASLWTDRAVSYRQANGIDQRSVALAVVVERMVDALAAGVMFTANPITGTRRQTVIDASPGLGEAVVSGAVNPDHFVVDRAARAIVQRRLGDKRLVITARPGGGTQQRVADDQSAVACLTDAQVLALADLGQRVQSRYGAPQDTEWALDRDGVFWLTQARPITTLYPQPETVAGRGSEAGPDRDGRPRIYMCLSLAQGLTRPITPMGIATFRLIGASLAAAAGRPVASPLRGPRPIVTPGQRVFADITGVVTNPLGRKLAIFAAGAMEARTATVLRSLADDPRFPVDRRSVWRAVAPVARVALLRAKLPLRLAVALISPRAAYGALDRAERRVRRALTLPANATPEQRLDHVESGIGGGLFLLMPKVFGYPACGLLMGAVARRMLGDLAGRGDLQTVLRGLPHNVTTEMDLELWDATQRIRRDPGSATAFAEHATPTLTARYRNRTLPPVAQRELAAFLRRYGHRAVAEIDLGMPRWSDDPTHIVGVIANYLRLDDPDLAPPAQFRKGIAAGEARLEELVARAARRSRLKARLVRFALQRARQLSGLRESPKFLLILGLSDFRRHLGMVGRHLAENGTVEAADDIFFLDLAEARQALAGEPMQERVNARRAEYANELRRRHIPRLILSDGTEPEAVAGAGGRQDGSLQGSPASPGTVKGPVRVILDPVNAHLEPGEILVAPSTDPGWTPLFLTAGGLVMEMGGSNSHGAVVAREYGIPAVVGVPDATRLLRTGQQVTVDGAAGSVTPAPA